MEVFLSRVLDRHVPLPGNGLPADHERDPLDLPVRPQMVRLGQAMLDPVGFADHIEAHRPGKDGVAVAGLLGELDAIACWE